MENLIEVKNLIYNIRACRVMLDSDLAMLYDVETRALNQAVKRNIERFPEDFMFQLTEKEWDYLRSQIVTSNTKQKTRGGRQYLPYAFTEQGIAMLSGVLKSKRAIQVNVQIMRTFVKLRQFAFESKDLAQRLTELEHYFFEHCKDNSIEIKELYNAINLLMDRTKPDVIGFKSN